MSLTLPAGAVGGWRGLGLTAEAPAILHAPTRSVGLVLLVGVTLDGELFLEAPLALAQRSGRDRGIGAACSARLIQPLASITQVALPDLKVHANALLGPKGREAISRPVGGG